MREQQAIKYLTVFVLTAAFTIGASHPAFAVQTFSVVTCALAAPTPCVGGTNTSTGPGVQGISNLGFGNVGQTKFNSTSATNGKSGLLGQDLSTSGINDEGVRGTSVRGLGVHGISSSRSGVRGDATTAQGVFGSSSSNTGTQGVSVTGTGIAGQSTSTTGGGAGGAFAASGHGNGVQASAISGNGGQFTSNTGDGVFASTGGSATGVVGTATSGVGLFGQGNFGVEGVDHGSSTNDVIFANGIGGRLFRANNSSGIDVYTLDNTGRITASGPITVGGPNNGTGLLGQAFSSGVHGVVQGTPGGFAAGVVGDNTSNGGTTAVYANGFGGFLFVGNNSVGSNVFTVDNAGNVFVQGNVNAGSYSSHAALTTLQRTRTGAEVKTFASQGATPTIEDFGEARLVGGSAYVPLKPQFGSAIDRNQPYLVFVTPQGAVRGMIYVTQKDARGFAVREAGGASSVAFDYRIVAKPYAAQSPASAIQPATPVKNRLAPPVFQRHTKVFPAFRSR